MPVTLEVLISISYVIMIKGNINSFIFILFFFRFVTLSLAARFKHLVGEDCFIYSFVFSNHINNLIVTLQVICRDCMNGYQSRVFSGCKSLRGIVYLGEQLVDTMLKFSRKNFRL